ncbi:MAG TPA: TVP38/TMEM64 family protein [Bryobacteraceae bacterium]|jgi:uncharacterized membrane protein YdjX (TVP38/TMEM64 family)
MGQVNEHWVQQGPTTCRSTDSGSPSNSKRYEKKWIAIWAACVVAVGIAWWLRKEGLLQLDTILRYRTAHPFAFVFLFISAYAVSVVFAVPTLPLNLAAGALWGPILGGVIAVAGMGSGAIAAFCAARFLFGQPLARRFDNRLVSWLQEEFEKSGWRFIAFLRLNPVFPAGPLNYILGLTSIRTTTYIWATVLFLLPPGMIVSLAGYSMGSFIDHRNFQAGFRTVLLISVAATTLVGMRYAAKYLRSQQSQ